VSHHTWIIVVETPDWCYLDTIERHVRSVIEEEIIDGVEMKFLKEIHDPESLKRVE
jgi:hypothetical protein